MRGAPGTPLQVRAWPGLRAGRADSLGPAARLRECEAEAATWAEADAPAGAGAGGGPAPRHGTTAALPEAAAAQARPPPHLRRGYDEGEPPCRAPCCPQRYQMQLPKLFSLFLFAQQPARWCACSTYQMVSVIRSMRPWHGCKLSPARRRPLARP